MDGKGLLYPGKTHSFHGESESGKSLVLLWEAIRLANEGIDSIWVDFDSDPAEFVKRCIAMGKTDSKHITYIRPDTRPRGEEDAQRLFGRKVGLVVLDGVTDALSLFGYGTSDNDDFATFARLLLRPFAEKTEAAVAIIDHVTKNKDDRGRYAIGGQHKMNVITGAAYMVEVVSLVAIGRRGEISLRVAKDRPGGVRPNSGAWRAKDRTQEAARVVVDSRDGRTVLTVQAPEMDPFSSASGDLEPVPLSDTEQEILDHLKENSDGVSLRALREVVGGRPAKVSQAVETLARRGRVRREDLGGNRGILHYPVDGE